MADKCASLDQEFVYERFQWINEWMIDWMIEWIDEWMN